MQNNAALRNSQGKQNSGRLTFFRKKNKHFNFCPKESKNIQIEQKKTFKRGKTYRNETWMSKVVENNKFRYDVSDWNWYKRIDGRGEIVAVSREGKSET